MWPSCCPWCWFENHTVKVSAASFNASRALIDCTRLSSNMKYALTLLEQLYFGLQGNFSICPPTPPPSYSSPSHHSLHFHYLNSPYNHTLGLGSNGFMARNVSSNIVVVVTLKISWSRIVCRWKVMVWYWFKKKMKKQRFPLSFVNLFNQIDENGKNHVMVFHWSTFPENVSHSQFSEIQN